LEVWNPQSGPGLPRSYAQAIFDVLEFVVLKSAIFNRAAQSFRTALGTLDALHLLTALWLAEAGSN
jgi:hypothetical protein